MGEKRLIQGTMFYSGLAIDDGGLESEVRHASDTAGLSVQNGMEGEKNWLKKAWEATNPNFKILDPDGTT